VWHHVATVDGEVTSRIHGRPKEVQVHAPVGERRTVRERDRWD
jgi:NAD(P)H-flavin reductase